MEGATDLAAQIAQLGKGLVQVNLRLTRLGEALDARASAHASAAAGGEAAASLDALLDLIEALELALERRRAPRGWFARRAARHDDDLWRGLVLARDAALERLARAGLEPVARSGAVDGLVHRVVEVVPAAAGEQRGTLAATHRRGWTRGAGAQREVVRTAQISVFGDPKVQP